VSDLQPVKRDFAFVVERSVPAAAILKAARAAERNLVKGVDVFDVFESDMLGAGKKSVAIEVTLQPAERTLTDDEIAGIARKIITEVGRATGATLRE
jgi:phenylalanyl-tRNA synthetase beta chain